MAAATDSRGAPAPVLVQEAQGRPYKYLMNPDATGPGELRPNFETSSPIALRQNKVISPSNVFTNWRIFIFS